MTNDIEIWESFFINNESTYYQISSHGRINSNYGRKIKIRKANDDGNGYLRISLAHNGDKFPKKVHRLVAEIFIPNPENLPEVNHKDGNKYNNKVSNLEWSTKSNNCQHAGEMGKLSRGSRKLPPIKIGKYFAGILLKTYPSLSRVKKDGYPRVSVSRAVYSGKNYKGFFWKQIETCQ